MATLTIRKLDESVKSRLRIRAARNKRSMEAEAREILKTGLGGEETGGLFTEIHKRFKALGGVDLETPRREPIRKPPTFR